MTRSERLTDNRATIFLNRPRSYLQLPPPPLLSPDEPGGPPPPQSGSPRSAWGRGAAAPPLTGQYTVRTLGAANTLSKLVTLPTPLIRHTPFLTCAITLACVVHLAACSCSGYGPVPGPTGWLLSGDEAFLAKERIRLAVGSLRALARVWALADDVLAQVQEVARELFRFEPDGGGDGIDLADGMSEEVLHFFETEDPALWGGADGGEGGTGEWGQGVRSEWDGTHGDVLCDGGIS